MGALDYIGTRHPASQKWDEVRDYMATHIHGKPPERILKNRRPLESQDPYAFNYRIDNFYPHTKEPFNLAINSIIESAEALDVSFENLEADTEKFIKDYKIKVASTQYSLSEYATNYLGRQIEVDPNAVLVVIPKHPQKEFKPDYREELINFNDITNRLVDLEIKLVSSEDVYYVDQSEVLFVGGDYLTGKDKEGGDVTHPYYWLISKEETRLVIPSEKDKEIEYNVYPYYNNELDIEPFVVIGANETVETVKVSEKYKSKEIEVRFYDSNLSGAVAFANEAIGVKSDLNIVRARFTYPHVGMRMKRCGAGCNPIMEMGGRSGFPNDSGGYDICTNCSGTGQVQPDTTPLGMFILGEDDFDSDGNTKPFVQYISPPPESAAHLQDAYDNEFGQMKMALYILDQNMTGQSGVSKMYDYRQKTTRDTNAVKNIYRNIEVMFNAIQGFFRQEQNVEVIYPTDFGVQTSEEIIQEITESKDAPSTYKAKLTTKLFLKRFGNTPVNRKIIRFLEVYDKLYGYAPDMVVRAKGLFGSDYTSRDIYIHDKGFSILQMIAEDNENFLEMTTADVKAAFDELVDSLNPVTVQSEPLV